MYLVIPYRKNPKKSNLEAVFLCHGAIEIWVSKPLNYYGTEGKNNHFTRGHFQSQISPRKQCHRSPNFGLKFSSFYKYQLWFYGWTPYAHLDMQNIAWKHLGSEHNFDPQRVLAQDSMTTVTKKCLAHLPVIQSLCLDTVENPTSQGFHLRHRYPVLSQKWANSSSNQWPLPGEIVDFSAN